MLLQRKALYEAHHNDYRRTMLADMSLTSAPFRWKVKIDRHHIGRYYRPPNDPRDGLAVTIDIFMTGAVIVARMLRYLMAYG